jgi:hypothetical protein
MLGSITDDATPIFPSHPFSTQPQISSFPLVGRTMASTSTTSLLPYSPQRVFCLSWLTLVFFVLVSSIDLASATPPSVLDFETRQESTLGGSSHSASRACTQLQSQLGTLVLTSPSPEYRNVSSNSWNRFNALSSPTCIVLPRSSVDVQVAMRAIFRHEVKYAVRSGGHSAMSGWSR